MKTFRLLALLVAIVGPMHALEPYTIEGDSVLIDGQARLTVAFSVSEIWLYDRRVTIRIFDRRTKTFPGNNSQIIQLLDEQGMSLAVQEIGGEPMFRRARVVPYFQTALVYVACEERRMEERTEYIYKIEQDLTLVPFNVYISPEEVEKARPKAGIDAKGGEKAVEKKDPGAGGAVSAPASDSKP